MRATAICFLAFFVFGGCTGVNPDYAPSLEDGATAGLPDGTIVDLRQAGEDTLNIAPPPCAATCGPRRDEDCCASLPIPGGTFNRSNDPIYPATISPFDLDRFEVTVGRFRAFIQAGTATQARPPAAGSGAHPAIPGSGWAAAWSALLSTGTAALAAALKCDQKTQTWTDNAGGNENRPINCVTWYEAFAFCSWSGGRLPTEAEWNFAAAGGNEQRIYPWSIPSSSTTIDSSYAVYGDALIADVGSYSPRGDGRWGQADLSGNVWERTLDGWDGVVEYPSPCVDCADIHDAPARTVRGGGYGYGPGALETAVRSNFGSATRRSDMGIRCAR